MKTDVFRTELSKIQNGALRDAVIGYFNTCVPDYFWSVPASLSGKHHSCFDAGEGGLVRHTKMCVLVAEELLRLKGFDQIDSDIIIAAMLIHDSQKNGKNGNHYRSDHPKLAAEEWANFAETTMLPSHIIKQIFYAVLWHSGQWSGPIIQNNFAKPKEYMALIKCAHLSDYVASRSFFNMIDKI